jgi:hypothetical protein
MALNLWTAACGSGGGGVEHESWRDIVAFCFCVARAGKKRCGKRMGIKVRRMRGFTCMQSDVSMT